MKFIFVVIFSFGGNVFSQALIKDQNQKNRTRKEHVEEKYARILNVHIDSLEHLPLYEILDKWPEFILSNPHLTSYKNDGVFAQFVYYLTFDTKIPSDINLLYKHKKTYLFKNPVYLRNGDLLFFGKEEKEPDKIAIFLQNNILVYPLADGRLKFINYDEIAENNSLTAAKIEKDG